MWPLIFILSFVTKVFGGITDFQNVKWSSCNRQSQCYLVTAQEMGEPYLFEAGIVFADNPTVVLSNTQMKHKVSLKAKTGTWVKSERKWVLYGVTFMDDRLPSGDYYLYEESMTLELAGNQ